MLPLLAIAGAGLASNVIVPAAAQALNGVQNAAGQANNANAATFQQLLAAKIASSPEGQKASFMSSERIGSLSQAQQRLADYGSRILQDPSVRKAMAGNTGPVELRFQSDGTVKVTTSSGMESTVTLQGDAKLAAQKATRVLSILQSAPSAGVTSLTVDGKVQPLGIRMTPGGGTATIVS